MHSKEKKMDGKLLLDYNNFVRNRLNKACHPLFSFFDLKMFTYSKTFNDGTRLYLNTDVKWLKLYIQNNFYNDIDHQVHYTSVENVDYALWTSWNRDKVFSALWDANFWNGFSVYKKSRDYIEMFDFATCRSNLNATEFYLNNVGWFDDFISSFKKKNSFLLNVSEKKLLMKIENWIPFEKICKNDLLCQERKTKFIKNIQF